jgi:hypothetical protein
MPSKGKKMHSFEFKGSVYFLADYTDAPDKAHNFTDLHAKVPILA